MVAIGLFTNSQYESSVIKRFYCMDCALGHLYGRNHAIIVSYHIKVTIDCYNNEEIVFQSPSSKKAEKELGEFHQFLQGH